MKEKIAIISIVANLVLAIVKIIGAILTNSASILAEGLHSLMDIFSSAIGFLGIRISKRPADQKHPYGHFKFEVLAGLTITIFLFFTGLWITFEGYQKSFHPLRLKMASIGLAIMAFSAILNEVMARIKIYYGKKESSVALLSDGVHSRVDVLVSLVVFLGLILAKYWVFADSFLAMIIGLYIIKESFSLGKEAVDSLLDVSAGEETENKIKEIVKGQNIALSSLRTQKKGSAITANLEINLPDNLSVNEATKISENLRKKLMDEVRNLSFVAIQIKSHEAKTEFYKPGFGFGRGFGWQGRGRFRGRISRAVGGGPGGYCLCPNCGYKVEHQRGTPCSSLKCPHCGTTLERKM